jgi:4'-phosphopantetheinyl transferase
LGRKEVHVWRARLDQPSDEVECLRQVLTPDEVARANRFHFEEGRRHFTVARGVLRAILSCYSGIEPSELRFLYGPREKPRLADETGGKWLRFNLSHSHGRALYAVAHGREVGIDLELIRSGRDHAALAERFFSSRESSTFLSLPEELQTEAFYLCWTRKEAYIKARGDGLYLPLNRFDVSLVPGEPAELLHAQDRERWSLHAFTPWQDYAAALVVEGEGLHLSFWE